MFTRNKCPLAVKCNHCGRDFTILQDDGTNGTVPHPNLNFANDYRRCAWEGGLSVGRPRYRAGNCGRRGSSTKAMTLRFVVDDLSDAGVEQLPSLADSFEIALHNNRFPSLVGLNGSSVVGVL